MLGQASDAALPPRGSSGEAPLAREQRASLGSPTVRRQLSGSHASRARELPSSPAAVPDLEVALPPELGVLAQSPHPLAGKVRGMRGLQKFIHIDDLLEGGSPFEVIP